LDTPSHTQETSRAAVRQLFNDHEYWERAQWGDLYQTVEEENHPSPPLAGEPECTHSQIVAYRDENGHQVARVHQYLKPDGSIGLSGRPDPLLLLHDGILYVAAED
jgi:hypothetical protein